MLNRSSAEAMKVASTEMRAVLIALSSFVLAGFAGAAAVFAGAAAGMGVEVPVLGVAAPDTVRSPPCVSTMAAANAVNLASNAAGSFDLASAKTASTGGEREVLSDHSYYCTMQQY